METGEHPDNKQICRLCLYPVPAGEAEAVGEKKKEILKILLINVDLHIIDNAVACSKCMDELQSGFEFKSACLHVDNCICTFVDADGPVDIKEVFHGEMRGTAMANVNLRNRQICRLCLSIIEDQALSCNTDLKDVIANCLPEVNMHTVDEPLVCGLCFSRIKKLNEFMKSCREVEQRINNCCQAAVDRGIPIACNLNDLLKFNKLIQGECSNFDRNVLKDPKKEDTAYIKCEEIQIKDELDSGDEMGDSIPSVACNSSRKSSFLKRKREVSKSKSKGKKHFSSGDHTVLTKEFTCQECTFETDRKSTLTQHMVRHKDKSEVKMHKCESCEYETRHKRCMIAHMAKHRDPGAERKFKCDKCSYETDSKFSLGRHNLRHKDISEVEMHKCENCQYETRYKYDMIRHMLKHRDPKAGKKFKCDKCSYETDFKSSLHTHDLIHKEKSEVEMHKCESCEFETRYKNNMVLHMRKHHEPKSERKFQCEKCPYKTDIKSNLCKHILSHRDKSEVEMHKCGECEFETRYKSSMNHHMMNHRDPIADRKFKCDKCSYDTDFKRYLRRHNLIHMDKSEVEMHKCDKCDFETKHKSSMVKHMVKHREPIV